MSLATLLLLAAAQAVEVHPAGPAVPENLLRIELRFAQAQPLPFDAGRLALLDEQGRTIDGALLDLALPSADGRHITVLMDPGRVKSGVGPNLATGRALSAGETVRLRLDAAQILKQWTVAAADSRPLQPQAWRIDAPRAGSREALQVALGRAISSTGETLIAVVDAAGRRVAGRTALADGDTVWRFTPARPWRSEAYTLRTHPELEDPAGNRSCAAFEQARASTLRCDAGASLRFSPAVRGAREGR